VFNSGYDLNLGLLSCLPQAQDVILLDELVHNSVILGTRLGRQKVTTTYRTPWAQVGLNKLVLVSQATLQFKHNDVQDLERCLKQARSITPGGVLYVAVEAVYSMEGDVAPLRDTLRVAERFNACVIVDEAHRYVCLRIWAGALSQAH
jgi:8-amino-7-oxononanoate synthase